MKNFGYISLSREIKDHWISSKPEYFMAWVFLIMEANHSDRELLIGGELVSIKRGSFPTSDERLISLTKMKKTKLRKFLNLLQKSNMIELNRSRKGTILNVLNYDTYQDSGNYKKTIEEPQKNHKRTIEEPQKNYRPDTNNNYNNVNNDNNKPKNDFYEIAKGIVEFYINKVGSSKSYHNKQQAIKNCCKVLESGVDKDNLISSIEKYVKDIPDKMKYALSIGNKFNPIKASNFFGKNEKFKEFVIDDTEENKNVYNEEANEVFMNYCKIFHHKPRGFHNHEKSMQTISIALETHTKEELIQFAENYDIIDRPDEYPYACFNFYGKGLYQAYPEKPLYDRYGLYRHEYETEEEYEEAIVDVLIKEQRLANV